VCVRVVRGDPGAEEVAGGLPSKAFAYGSPDFRKFLLQPLFKSRWGVLVGSMNGVRES
jgi:hypothetical protein